MPTTWMRATDANKIHTSVAPSSQQPADESISPDIRFCLQSLLVSLKGNLSETLIFFVLMVMFENV